MARITLLPSDRILRHTPAGLQALAEMGPLVPVTIEDVARTAGVSTATVSRALRGLPHVNESTRASVAQAASELGYVASKSASTLASGRTDTIGVVTPHIAQWFFAHALEALEAELRAVGYDVLVQVLPHGARTTRPRFDPEQLRQRVDALAVLTVPLSGQELDSLRALDLPTVFVAASVAGAMSVRVDDVAVGRLATEHLLALGHTRIAYVGGDPDEPLNYHAPIDRRTGWMTALRATGRSPDPRWEVPGLFTVDGGRRALDELLTRDPRPTAVFAASDEMAFGVIAQAREAGLAVPDDLSVVGVDDHDFAALFGLTTVAQPVEEQGRAAGRLLLGTLAGASSYANEHLLLPVQLVQRSSTSPVHATATSSLPDR